MKKKDKILLAHGAGGRLTHDLVREMFLPKLDNPYLSTLSDSARLPNLPPGRPALTTDAFVVDPPVFPGGNLGYLSVCGTVNDLAVSGADPLWLTWALILEEGADHELIEVVLVPERVLELLLPDRRGISHVGGFAGADQERRQQERQQEE